MNKIAEQLPTQAAIGCERSPWQVHAVRIARRIPEVPEVATYHLEFCDPAVAAAYRFVPGQFNMLYVPGAGESAISLSADPAGGPTWAHTVRTVGNVTRALEELGAGGMLGLRGPFGRGWPLAPIAAARQDLIVVAGGIGLAPLRPALYAVLARRSDFQRVVLIYGARSPDLLLYQAEWEEWQSRGIELHVTVDRPAPGWNGNIGVVPQLLRRLEIPNPARAVVLTCGPEVMMRFTAQAAVNCGIPREQIWVSQERHMQCAIGLCGHCQFGPTLICRDGPVFRYDTMAEFLAVGEL